MADNSGRFEAVPAIGFPPFPQLLTPFVTSRNQIDLFIDDLRTRRLGRFFVAFYPVLIRSHSLTNLAILPLASPEHVIRAAKQVTGEPEFVVSSHAFAYLARFQTVLKGLPNVLTPLQVSSSPARVNIRFESVPIQFGNEQPSKWMLMVFAAASTEYVPKAQKHPCTTALFSSAVPSRRLLDANLGRSDRIS
jgi:hypothetical protein